MERGMLKGGTASFHINKKVSEYDQEAPQSHTADQPSAP